ncbi:TrmB family transcriptional regulator [Methanosarcina mazei]|nr:helix-turn-helix domain-containing protein [Methanosarcina mazei]
MQNEQLLQEVGLNAYEAAAYLSLLKLGVSEASDIYRDSEVPYGKIYSVLESLAGKGFVEVQASRPSKNRYVSSLPFSEFPSSSTCFRKSQRLLTGVSGSN